MDGFIHLHENNKDYITDTTESYTDFITIFCRNYLQTANPTKE